MILVKICFIIVVCLFLKHQYFISSIFSQILYYFCFYINVKSIILKDILLITPPFTQLNTPYPATAYLKGFLKSKNIDSFQIDLGIEVILELFTKINLKNLFEFAFSNNKIISQNAKRIYSLRNEYVKNIDSVILFLQGKNQTFARQICNEDFLPQASKFENSEDYDWTFGSMGFQDKAKHLATLYLEDLSDFIVECVDENFGFSRYAEQLGKSANSFDQINENLQKEISYIDKITIDILDEKIKNLQPKLICFSVPFPGNLFSAFRCAQFVKKNYPEIKTAMGGGFPNTELRSISETKVFDYFDFITLDDGELPLELLISNVFHNKNEFKRTFLRENNEVVFKNNSTKNDYKQNEVGTPDYSDLFLDKYISVIEIPNPMHSLWSDGRWNKLTLAHGCYWGKCTFCDGSLDYIKRYDTSATKILVDKIEKIISQTGETGFHFVDEAASPSILKTLAIELIKREINITWWTNIRFEKSFNHDLCLLLRESGCIAVSGGLEVASDRLLNLINKGVTVEQVAQVTNNFTNSGIMVHAYLMYGYPTQTIQETVDSLEMVRQMFEAGIIHSGFWHQFALTVHSPIGNNPEKYNIVPQKNKITFADNDVQFIDKTGINHSKFSFGLKKSIYNFMHEIGFDIPLQDWFDFKIPKTSVKPNYIENCIELQKFETCKASSKIFWIGTEPEITFKNISKKGKTTNICQLSFQNKKENFNVNIEKEKAEWLIEILKKLKIGNEIYLTYSELKTDYENHFEEFDMFWYSKTVDILRENGLLVL